MNDQALPTWRSWLTTPLGWPLPAVLVHLAVLLSPRVWGPTTSHGRTTVPAHAEIMMLVASIGVYTLLHLAPGALTAGGSSWRVRAPTDAERGCVVVLLKGLCLLALYASAYAYASSYLFG